MTPDDARIRAALDVDDDAFIADLEDNRGLFTQYFATFHGPVSVWNWIVLVLTLAATGVGVYAAWRFVVGADVREMLLWGGAAWAAWTIQIASKQWVYDRMNHLAALREMKKLEWRLVRLEERLSGAKAGDQA